MLDHVIGTVEPDDVSDMDINILGEFNLSGEFWSVKPLLERLGMRLRVCFPGDARYHEIASAHRARATMMVCSTALINLARKMEERWGIPYFEGSFYGITDTSEALRSLARLLVQQGADGALLERSEALIAEEEEIAWAKLHAFRPRLEGKRVLLNTGGVKSWSVVHALQEVGIEIVGTSVKKSTVEDKERIKQILKDENHMFESMLPRELYAMLAEHKADIMLSGGRTQFIALKAKMPWLDINQERHHPYAAMTAWWSSSARSISRSTIRSGRPCASRHPGMPRGCRSRSRRTGYRCCRSRPNRLRARAGSPKPHSTRWGNADEQGRVSKQIGQRQSAQILPAAGGSLCLSRRCRRMPLFHGSQGCTSFALVLLVRHFKETIPLQTTAMDEVATVLGGVIILRRRFSI